MNKKLLAELEKYLSSLKAGNPEADHTRAGQLLADLTKELETLDPADPFTDGLRRGAGLDDGQPAEPTTDSPEDAAFAAAVRKGAGWG